MKRQRPANTTLDELGRQLIRRSRPNAADIDGVVSTPQLFEQVRSRTRSLERTEPHSRTGFAGSLTVIYRYGKLIAGTAAAAVIVAAAGWALRFSGPQRQEYAVQSSTSVSDRARPVYPPEISYELSPGRASLSERKDREKPAKRTVPIVYRKPQTQRPAEADEEEFYPIYASGGADEPLSGGRIVRVNMQRSSLLALGVNLPLENDTGSVTADLLVGPDGVTRAFRVIK